jgi:hypothetical protein
MAAGSRSPPNSRLIESWDSLAAYDFIEDPAAFDIVPAPTYDGGGTLRLNANNAGTDIIRSYEAGGAGSLPYYPGQGDRFSFHYRYMDTTVGDNVWISWATPDNEAAFTTEGFYLGFEGDGTLKLYEQSTGIEDAGAVSPLPTDGWARVDVTHSAETVSAEVYQPGGEPDVSLSIDATQGRTGGAFGVCAASGNGSDFYIGSVRLTGVVE